MPNQIQNSQRLQITSYLQNKAEITAAERDILVQLQKVTPLGDICIIPDTIARQCTEMIEASLGLPQPGTRVDVSGTLAKLNDFEALIILFAAFARQTRQMRHEEAMGALQNRVSQLKTSAATREKGADELKSHALTAMIVSIVAGGISVAGGVLSGLGGLKASNELARLAPKGTQITKGITEAANMAGSSMNAASQAAAGIAQSVKAGADYASTSGQSENQRANAQADKQQAVAAEFETAQQNKKDMEQESDNLIDKLVEILKNTQEAKNKTAAAAAGG